VALVGAYFAEHSDEIVLMTRMTKFPVVRDLMVDRARLFVVSPNGKSKLGSRDKL